MEIITLINTLENVPVLKRSVGHMKINAQDSIVYKAEALQSINVNSDEYTNLRQLCIVEKKGSLFLYLTLEAATGDWYLIKYNITDVVSINFLQ